MAAINRLLVVRPPVHVHLYRCYERKGILFIIFIIHVVFSRRNILTRHEFNHDTYSNILKKQTKKGRKTLLANFTTIFALNMP